MISASPFLSVAEIRRARGALTSEGYLIIENGYPESVCREIIALIDAHVADEKTEIRYSGTELRIWEAQRRHPLLASFYQKCNLFMSSLINREVEAFTLLAIRNQPVDPSDEKSTIGRWHIDSFLRQLKIFLFLTDTTEESGPFEFLPGSHTARFKIWILCNGMYFRLADFVGQKRSYQRLDDHRLRKLAAVGFRPVPVVCKAGTIMVIDTSAIHRARPCRQGSRYALTAYFR